MKHMAMAVQAACTVALTLGAAYNAAQAQLAPPPKLMPSVTPKPAPTPMPIPTPTPMPMAAVEERNNCDFERISCDAERIVCEWRPVGGIAARPADWVNGSNQTEPRMP